MAKPKKIPEKEAKSGQVDKLKKRISALTRERDHWKSKFLSAEKTFRSAIKETSDSYGEYIQDVKVEELIEACNDKRDLRKLLKDRKEVDNSRTCGKCYSNDIHIGAAHHGSLIICRSCKHTEILKDG